jgi:integrase
MARGSVTRRSDGWCIRLDVGADPATGKRRQVSRQGFRTKREAQAVLNDLMLERELVRQPDVSVFGPTVGDYLEEWLARARVSVRESTWAAYRNAVGHLVDGLAGGSLRLLSPLEVERFEQQLLASGRSAKTVANVHSVLHRALADAVRDGLVDRNVASLVSPPRAERPEMSTWTVAELKQFLRSVEGHRLYAAFVVLATTGMRRGEVLGLQRGDVDLARAELSVRRAVGVVDGRIEIGPPRSASSRRLVALDTTTTAVLADHLEQRSGPVWVFPGEGDGPLNPASFSTTFERLVARAGVPRIRVHDLRHTYATIALRAGVHPAIVSERLGHSSIAVTIDLYSHAVPGLQSEAAGVVGDLILGAAAPPVGGEDNDA